jgi:hypothetical protein
MKAHVPSKREFDRAVTAVNDAIQEETAFRILGRLVNAIDHFNRRQPIGSEIFATTALTQARQLLRHEETQSIGLHGLGRLS